MKKTPPPNSRRNFLGISLLTIPTLSFIAPFGLSKTSEEDVPLNNKKLYLSESGLMGVDSHIVISCLDVGNESPVLNTLSSLRSQFNYNSIFSYTSSDKFKIPFAKAFIDEFVSNDKFSFSAYVLPEEEFFTPNKPSRKQRLTKKTDAYKSLLEQHKNKNWQQAVMKSQSHFGPTNKFKEKFKEKSGKDVTSVVTMDNDLAQVANFLTGNLFAEIVYGEIKNATKNELYEYLKSQLSITTLQEGKPEKFDIYTN